MRLHFTPWINLILRGKPCSNVNNKQIQITSKTFTFLKLNHRFKVVGVAKHFCTLFNEIYKVLFP